MRLSWVWMGLLTLPLVALPAMSHSATSVTLKVPAHTLVIHPTVTSATAACKVPHPKKPGEYMRVRGCWNAARLTLHIQKPSSFCDADDVSTAGHEYLHIVGFRHAANHKPAETVTSGCARGEFTQ